MDRAESAAPGAVGAQSRRSRVDCWIPGSEASASKKGESLSLPSQVHSWTRRGEQNPSWYQTGNRPDQPVTIGGGNTRPPNQENVQSQIW